MKFERINTETEYGRGYDEAWEVAEQYTKIAIADMIETLSKQWAVLRSLEATKVAEVLAEVADDVRNGRYERHAGTE